MTVDARAHTAEDLLGFPKWPRYELVEGELREMPPSGGDHSAIALRIGSRMLAYVEQHRLGGRVYGADAGFVLSRNPDTVVAPDVAYVASERVVPSPKFFPGAPDVAVEVISPGDSYSEVSEKKYRYLAAGTRAVVIVDPRRLTVHVHRTSGETNVSGALTLDELPGWSMSLDDIFTTAR